ncbi:MAG TPA: hypothetical protein VNX18_01435 [Bryobacteraceae bacterium]|nr:hypothetical protein [Bryobacteraceae bacterium]
MILRVRLRRGRPFQRQPGKNRHVALAFAGLMTPLALMAYVLGFWRLASDLGIVGESGITGIFSHWQVWIPLGASLQLARVSLIRYGTGGRLKGPRIVIFPGLRSSKVDAPDEQAQQQKVASP